MQAGSKPSDPLHTNLIYMETILLIVLILLLIGALPRWSYSSGWGYFPSGIVGIVLIILIIMMLMGTFRS